MRHLRGRPGCGETACNHVKIRPRQSKPRKATHTQEGRPCPPWQQDGTDPRPAETGPGGVTLLKELIKLRLAAPLDSRASSAAPWEKRWGLQLSRQRKAISTALTASLSTNNRPPDSPPGPCARRRFLCKLLLAKPNRQADIWPPPSPFGERHECRTPTPGSKSALMISRSLAPAVRLFAPASEPSARPGSRLHHSHAPRVGFIRFGERICVRIRFPAHLLRSP